MKMDFRLSTTLVMWRNGVGREIMEKAREAARGGRMLSGKHPDVQALAKVIPDDCIMCHGGILGWPRRSANCCIPFT